MADIVDAVKTEVPQFNDYLIKGFRQDKMRGIPEYLCTLFSETIKLFEDDLTFDGYDILTPEERIRHMRTTLINKNNVEVQHSSFALYRFKFGLRGEPHELHAHVPYLHEGAVWLSDTRYHPLFPVVERVIHVNRKSPSVHYVTIKVLRAPIVFWRRKEIIVRTVQERLVREAVLTIKIHQGGKNSKKSEHTPLTLYHFAIFGFYEALKIYMIGDDEISMVEGVSEEEGYDHLHFTENIYIKFKTDILKQRYKRRMLIQLMLIAQEHNRFPTEHPLRVDDIVSEDGAFFRVILGKFAYDPNKDSSLLFKNASDHIATTDTMLDPIAQDQMRGIDIDVDSIYDLLWTAFFRIDKWITGYEPSNLYTKKLGSLDLMMAQLVRTTFINHYNVLNNSQGELTSDQLRKLLRKSSKPATWFGGNSVFRANPSMYNSNWLMAIGLKWFRSMETETGGGKGGGGKRPPKSLITAHKSHVAVTTILSIPPSNPCVAGTINPFLEIDKDGNIQDYLGDVLDGVYE